MSRELTAKAIFPRAGVIFNAIGESHASREHLKIVEEIVARLNLPVINEPQRVAQTQRVRAANLLAGVDNCTTPRVERTSRERLLRGELPLAFPMLVRPVDSHAGHGLALVRDAGEMQAYLDRERADTYFSSAFVDYRASDGYYRKYRIIVVDGTPYPYHLAISKHWMIHYYNAQMKDERWMRDEEERFLTGFESVFDERLRGAIAEIAHRLQLEYFGIDCSIDGDGKLLLFEADPAMLVHDADPVDLFAYKRRFVSRIFAAVEGMIDARARPR